MGIAAEVSLIRNQFDLLMLLVIVLFYRASGRRQSTITSDIRKVRPFLDWVHAQGGPSITTPTLENFLWAQERKPSYHNRMGTEIARFVRYNVPQGRQVEFTRKLEPPLDPVVMAPKERE